MMLPTGVAASWGSIAHKVCRSRDVGALGEPGAIGVRAEQQIYRSTGPNTPYHPRTTPTMAPVHPRVEAALNLAQVWLDAHTAFAGLPGVAAGVVLGEELVWDAGFGCSNVEAGTPADGDTI